MPKVAKLLSDRAIRALKCNLSQSGEEIQTFHAIGGVPGLGVQVTPSGARSYLLRTSFNGRRIKTGLGSVSAIGPSQARREAREFLESLRQGIDPRETKKAARRAQSLSRSFEQVALEYLTEVIYQRRNANRKNLAQWESTLRTYAFPQLGHLNVAEITSPQIANALMGIWTTKTDTADKLKSRIKAVLSHAKAKGYVPAHHANPADWESLKHLLPPKRDVQVKNKQPYLHLRDVHRFWRDLSSRDDLRAKCLAFGLLTATRSESLRGARWEEINEEQRSWTIPASRMKSGRAFTVALSSPAIALLGDLPRTGDLIFPNSQGREPHSTYFSNYIKKQMHPQSLARGEGGYVDHDQKGTDGSPKVIVPHGFRATFETWALSESSHDRVTIDIALDHKTGQDMHEHYLRGDVFSKRLRLMNEFALFVTGGRNGA